MLPPTDVCYLFWLTSIIDLTAEDGMRVMEILNKYLLQDLKIQ